MPDYERSSSIGIGPAAAFAYLADARNMPAYIAFMTEASAAGAGALHVAAEVQGRHEEGDATLTADERTMTIRWSRAGSEYSGWLRVTPDGADGQSTVTIHIHTRDDSDSSEIEQAIQDSLANIRSAAAAM